MKLSFWTLGMPDWSASELAERASRFGYHAVDLRCRRRDGKPISRPINVDVAASPDSFAETKAILEAANVGIASLLCYNGSPCTNDAAAWSTFENEVALHAEAAKRLGTSRLRLAAEGPAEGVTWDSYMVEIWRAVCRVLDHFPGMEAIVENHVGRANAFQLLSTAAKVGDPRVGLSLSPGYTYVMQENVFELIERYAPYIHQVCWADRKVVQHELGRFDKRYYNVRYEACWIGDGFVPTEAILSALARHGFDDYVSLKWEKSATYGAQLAPGEDALEHFSGYMRAFGFFESVEGAASAASRGTARATAR